MAARGRGQGRLGVTVHMWGFSFWDDESVVELIAVIDA